MAEVWLEVLEIVCVIPGSGHSHCAHTNLLFEYKEDVQSLQEMNKTQDKLCICVHWS